MPHAIASYRQSATSAPGSDEALENFSAALVEVVYPIVLRQEMGDSWIDLELALWTAISETLNGRCNAIPAGRLKGD